MNIIDIASMRGEKSEIEAQAREWVIRLDKDTFSGQDKQELAEWLGRSPLHLSVFRDVASAWVELDQLSELAGDNRAGAGPEAGFSFSLFSRATAIATALVLAVVLSLAIPALLDAGAEASDYVTAVGEVRRVDLPDGSFINLNTNTSINVLYTRNARYIRLGGGEAYFDVAHDSKRPFLVYVGKYAVKAVGTAFSIESDQSSIDVIVTDGRIEVSSFDFNPAESGLPDLDIMETAGSLVPLDKGQMGIFNEEVGKLELVQEINAGNLEKNLSWRDGMLIFDNDSLDLVVSEINRYMPARVVISDSSIRDLRVGGYFEIADIAAILATMERDYGIEVDQVAENLIYLSRAEERVP